MTSVRFAVHTLTALIAAAVVTVPATAGPVQPVGKRLIEPFDYKGVTLQGSFRRQFDQIAEYYLRLPNDDALRAFRLRAGKPAPGKDMGGGFLAHLPFPQFISGMARMYAASGDTRYRDKAISLMTGWAECIEPDGFCYPERETLHPTYFYDKFAAAMMDVYVYCGDKRALGYLSKITDWAEKHLNRARGYANSSMLDDGEWYTLSEQLHRAYLLTGEKRYEEFAKVWEYRDYWDFFANGKATDIFTKCGGYHAYSHVNTFSGLGGGYLVTGDPYYLRALTNAYDYYRDYQWMATGGYGPTEAILDRPGFVSRIYCFVNHFETQCGSWAGFKMTKYLMSFTGDARYGDWTERLTLNCTGASIPPDTDGCVFYYAEYSPFGSYKRTISTPWSCCSGTLPEVVADYDDIIYFHDADSLYVNLFAASDVKFHGATIAQRTSFPESDRTRLVVSTKSPSRFAVKLRVPGWLAGPMTATVNGKSVGVKIDAKHWAVFDREWKDGDTLEVRTPMKLWISRLTPDSPYPAALMYGPVTLALRPSEGNPAKKVDFERLDSSLIPCPGEPLTWRLASDPSILVRPFYAFKAGERYFLYLDPSDTFPSAPYTTASYTGEWKDYRGWMTSTTPGSYVEYTFKGKGIRVGYNAFDDSGTFEVSVDGKPVGTIDEYVDGRGWFRTADFAGLEDGTHTVRLTVAPKANPSSKAMFTNVATFETLK